MMYSKIMPPSATCALPLSAEIIRLHTYIHICLLFSEKEDVMADTAQSAGFRIMCPLRNRAHLLTLCFLTQTVIEKSNRSILLPK
jgi:hypothetical protein